jgi:hypothetical protein
VAGYGHIARDVAVNFLTKYTTIMKYNEKEANEKCKEQLVSRFVDGQKLQINITYCSK